MALSYYLTEFFEGQDPFSIIDAIDNLARPRAILPREIDRGTFSLHDDNPLYREAYTGVLTQLLEPLVIAILNDHAEGAEMEGLTATGKAMFFMLILRAMGVGVVMDRIHLEYCSEIAAELPNPGDQEQVQTACDLYPNNGTAWSYDVYREYSGVPRLVRRIWSDDETEPYYPSGDSQWAGSERGGSDVENVEREDAGFEMVDQANSDSGIISYGSCSFNVVCQDDSSTDAVANNGPALGNEPQEPQYGLLQIESSAFGPSCDDDLADDGIYLTRPQAERRWTTEYPPAKIKNLKAMPKWFQGAWKLYRRKCKLETRRNRARSASEPPPSVKQLPLPELN